MSDINITVDTGGTGDYTSTVDALAGAGTDYNADLVAAQGNLVIALKATTGLPEILTETLTIPDGVFTVNEQYHIIFETDSDHYHRGIFPFPAYSHYYTADPYNSDFGFLIDCFPAYTEFRRIGMLWETHSGNHNYKFALVMESATGHYLIDDCFCRIKSGTWLQSAGYYAGQNVTCYFRNSAAICSIISTGTYTWGYPMYVHHNSIVKAYNCTFLNTWGPAVFSRDDSVIDLKNCILYGEDFYPNSNVHMPYKDVWNTSGNWDLTDWTATNNNALIHNTPPPVGSNWIDYSAFEPPYPGDNANALNIPIEGLFVDPTSGSSALLYGIVDPVAIDLRNDPILPVTTDITGRARGATSYLGAYIPQPPEYPVYTVEQRRRKIAQRNAIASMIDRNAIDHNIDREKIKNILEEVKPDGTN